MLAHPITSEFRRLKQEGHCKFKASLDYIANPVSKNASLDQAIHASPASLFLLGGCPARQVSKERSTCWCFWSLVFEADYFTARSNFQGNSI